MTAIAAAHSVSLAALKAANPQVGNPEAIYPGEVLSTWAGALRTRHRYHRVSPDGSNLASMVQQADSSRSPCGY